jgi:mycoredoxin
MTSRVGRAVVRQSCGRPGRHTGDVLIGPNPVSVSAAEGEAAAADGRVVIYHRKGCSYCLRMRLALGKRVTEATWVDIWADPEGAAYVRSVNHGDETVPTVVIDGAAHTNPPPRVVRAALNR